MTANVDIRPYTDADHDGVVALWRSVFPDDPPWNEPEFVLERKLAVQPELLFVALIGPTVVGTAMAGYDGHRAWVYTVAVDPEHRRRGIASTLMGRVEDALKLLGCPKLNLQVRATNSAVVAFYRKLGYHTEDRVSMGKLLEERFLR